MVVYRFKVFAFDDKRLDAFVGNQRSSYIANHVFDKLRIFICFFRYILLVRAFEQTVELAACLCFDVIDDFFNVYIRVCNQAAVTCERWLCAPYWEISLEHGHNEVTGTITFRLWLYVPFLISPVRVTS